MFTLDQVVPWGRSFDEYRRMFILRDRELHLRILGCGDGPANFNAEAARRGLSVTSCDPLYRWDAAQIRDRIAQTFVEIFEQTRRNADQFVWDVIGSVEELGKVRIGAMNDFLQDYPAGKTEGRYVDAALPTLPLADASFDLALSSHFLFLYTSQLGREFHRSAIHEMCRVAAEVRIFPLLTLAGTRSPLVDPIAGELAGSGFAVSIQRVPYEFQRGGNEMMVIRHEQEQYRSPLAPHRGNPKRS